MELQQPRVAWIGVGRMGTPICRNIMAAGLPLTVFDVRRSCLAAFAEAGARVARSPTDAASNAHIIATMVPDDAALLDIALGSGKLCQALTPDQILVDFSTVSPAASAKVAAALEQTGARYVRCPVSGSVSTAASAQLTIFASGDRVGFEATTPLFAAISAGQQFLGNGEEARVVKLLVNMLVGMTPAILAEALAFGAALGLDRAAAMQAINASVFGSALTAYKAAAIVQRDWSPMASVDLVVKDADLALGIGRDHDVQMPFTVLARELYGAAQARGDGGRDFFKIVDWPEHFTVGVPQHAVRPKAGPGGAAP